MSRIPEQQVVQSTVDALDRVAESTDADSAQALNRARRHALESAGITRPRPWLWVTAAATAIALAVVIARVPGNGEEQSLLAQQPVAEPELYEEMEFYLWLAQELESE